jgi:hypothetical protein
MKKAWLSGMTLLAFALCALPALAASPDPAAEAALAAIFAPAPGGAIPAPAQDAAASRGLPTKSTSTANCWDGSIVTCTGTTSSAVNSSCPSQRGSCTGSTSGTINCPACPTGGCSISTTCSPGGTISCTGAAGYQGCTASKNCWVDCGGSLVWCPHHAACEV